MRVGLAEYVVNSIIKCCLINIL